MNSPSAAWPSTAFEYWVKYRSGNLSSIVILTPSPGISQHHQCCTRSGRHVKNCINWTYWDLVSSCTLCDVLIMRWKFTDHVCCSQFLHLLLQLLYSIYERVLVVLAWCCGRYGDKNAELEVSCMTAIHAGCALNGSNVGTTQRDGTFFSKVNWQSYSHENILLRITWEYPFLQYDVHCINTLLALMVTLSML